MTLFLNVMLLDLQLMWWRAALQVMTQSLLFHIRVTVFGQLGCCTAEMYSSLQVQAADSLLKLVSELKQSAVFSDFLSLNRSINQRIIKLGELSQDADKLLVNIGEEITASLQELESHYYASPYRTLEIDPEMLQPPNSDGA